MYIAIECIPVHLYLIFIFLSIPYSSQQQREYKNTPQAFNPFNSYTEI